MLLACVHKSLTAQRHGKYQPDFDLNFGRIMLRPRGPIVMLKFSFTGTESAILVERYSDSHCLSVPDICAGRK